jgi:hypothetical protein
MHQVKIHGKDKSAPWFRNSRGANASHFKRSNLEIKGRPAGEGPDVRLFDFRSKDPWGAHRLAMGCLTIAHVAHATQLLDHSRACSIDNRTQTI